MGKLIETTLLDKGSFEHESYFAAFINKVTLCKTIKLEDRIKRAYVEVIRVEHVGKRTKFTLEKTWAD